jgi:hypothetical protein
MAEEEKYTLEEAHQRFAKTTNGRVWELLDKPQRTAAEAEEMLIAAYASLFHWLHIGTAANAQRGHWLLARVLTVLGRPGPALEHAARCLQLTETYRAEMSDFDLAYAHEALARAHALGGDKEKAREHLHLAAEAGEAVSDPEDRRIFMGDFRAGEWFGVT